MSNFFVLFILISGLLVLVSKNPIHSVLFLIFTFLNSAGVLLLLGMDFLAMLLVIVYAGAVAVLFLFIVMMLNLKIVGFSQTVLNHYPIGVGVLLLLLSGLYGSIVYVQYFYSISETWSTDWSNLVQQKDDLKAIGNIFYTYQFNPFLISSIVLLNSMIIAIVLTFDRSVADGSHRQQIYQQVIRANQVVLSI